MLGINESSDAAFLLRLSNSMDSQRSLTRTFWSIDFDNSAFGITAHAQCSIQCNTSRWNHSYIFNFIVAELHNRAFTKIFLDFGHRGLQRFQLFAGC